MKHTDVKDKKQAIDNAIKANVINVYGEVIKTSPVVKEMVDSGKLKVVLAEYYISTGKVEVIEN